MTSRGPAPYFPFLHDFDVDLFYDPPPPPGRLNSPASCTPFAPVGDFPWVNHPMFAEDTTTTARSANRAAGCELCGFVPSESGVQRRRGVCLMFCPECGAEYREGIVKCSDCDVALVATAPEPPEPEQAEWVDLVTVLTSSDPALLAVAKSLLEADGITFIARGEGLQDLFGLGRVGGFNAVTGPVEIQVSTAAEAEARRLLVNLEPP